MPCSASKMSFIIRTILCLSTLFFLFGNAYDPIDDVFNVLCGFRGTFHDEHNRTWTGDIPSEHFLIESPQSLQIPPPYNHVPYSNVRLSNSNFTYSFSVTAGQKFIRLYIYPTSYGHCFERSKAFFSVTSGTFTLLKDFNASLTADADDDRSDIISREYVINVDEGQRLNLTFSPSTTQPDLYAFINGFQIVSMPTNLYYTDSQKKGLKLAGSTTFHPILNNCALETVYRLNVGGSDLPPSRDTGLLRYWKTDSTYVSTDSTPSVLRVDLSGTKLSFSQASNYTAPDLVYRTARSMGTNGAVNKISNLTWEFPVDSGFTYMLRLHFCEFDPNITLPGDRVFYIYIDDKLAEDAADVLKWSKQKGVPVHRDYAVKISGNEKKYNLSLKLQPNSDVPKTAYFDAFLNGLEIFRISDPQNNNLAVPNPDLTPAKPIQNPNKRRIKTIITTVTGVVSSLSLLFLVAFFVNRQGKKLNDTKPSEGTSSIPSYICRRFSIAEIRVATEHFSEHFIIGKGGFGNVYKGYIDIATTPVAIKRLKQGSQQGAQEFMTEIEMLSQLVHRNLVSLIGYCNDENEMILVYQFVAHGTLRDHLYNTDKHPLSWKQRLQICIGAAHGLYYLHAGARHNIIHRDVKSTNILLDEKWVAKVSDFGLSKIGPTEVSSSHITTAVKGSFGYLDPEYYMRQRLTLKSDVYAFGVVLLEVMCGRPPFLRSVEKEQASLVEWVEKCHSEGKIDQTVDPCLKGTIADESLKKFSDLAIECLLDDGNQRPPMNEVVWGLKHALKLQATAELATSSFININDDEKDLNTFISSSYHNDAEMTA